MKRIKILVEKHSDGYVGYPLGLKGVVVGEGDTYEEALADVKSAKAAILRLLAKKFWKPSHLCWKPLLLKRVSKCPGFPLMRLERELSKHLNYWDLSYCESGSILSCCGKTLTEPELH